MTTISTAAAIPPAAGVPYTARVDGATIHPRGFALALVYPMTPGAAFDSDPRLRPHAFLPGAWRYDGVPRHTIWTVAPNRIVVTQLSTAKPNIRWAESLGTRVLGPGARPISRIAFPLAMRMALRPSGALGFAVPSGGFLCQRLWPEDGQRAHMTSVLGHEVELRVSGSRSRTGRLHLYAETFIGRSHETHDGAPRSFLYAEDARHLLKEHSRLSLQRFTVRLMDTLLGFAHDARTLGVEVDPRKPLSGGIIGRVRALHDVDDIEVAVDLPQPGGAMKFVGSWLSP